MTAVLVVTTDQADHDFASLTLTVQERVLSVFERLADWPRVSGAKALSGDWRGHWRIRTGDYRVIFRPEGIE